MQQKNIIILLVGVILILVGVIIGYVIFATPGNQKKYQSTSDVINDNAQQTQKPKIEFVAPGASKEIQIIGGIIEGVGKDSLKVRTVTLAGPPEVGEKQKEDVITANITAATSILKQKAVPVGESTIPARLDEIKQGMHVTVKSNEDMSGRKEIEAAEIILIPD